MRWLIIRVWGGRTKTWPCQNIPMTAKRKLVQERRGVRKHWQENTEACSAYSLPFLISIGLLHYIGLHSPLISNQFVLQGICRVSVFFFNGIAHCVRHWVTFVHWTLTSTGVVLERGAAVNYDHIFKIILIGDNGVGKSSFIRRCVMNNCDPSYTHTLKQEMCILGVAAWLPVSNGLYSTQPQGHCPEGDHLACDCDTICVWVHAHWLGSNSGHILSKSILVIQDDERHWCVYKSPVK